MTDSRGEHLKFWDKRGKGWSLLKSVDSVLSVFTYGGSSSTFSDEEDAFGLLKCFIDSFRYGFWGVCGGF